MFILCLQSIHSMLYEEYGFRIDFLHVAFFRLLMSSCCTDLINFCDKNPLSEMEDPVFRRKMCVSIAMVKCMFSNLGTPRRLTVEQVFDELLLV